MAYMKFSSDYEEMRISKQHATNLPCKPCLPHYAKHTHRRSNLYVTGLLNCAKSGKNARFAMVEYTVVKNNKGRGAAQSYMSG
jgi:hypothetical protein